MSRSEVDITAFSACKNRRFKVPKPAEGHSPKTEGELVCSKFRDVGVSFNVEQLIDHSSKEARIALANELGCGACTCADVAFTPDTGQPINEPVDIVPMVLRLVQPPEADGRAAI